MEVELSGKLWQTNSPTDTDSIGYSKVTLPTSFLFEFLSTWGAKTNLCRAEEVAVFLRSLASASHLKALILYCEVA